MLMTSIASMPMPTDTMEPNTTIPGIMVRNTTIASITNTIPNIMASGIITLDTLIPGIMVQGSTTLTTISIVTIMIIRAMGFSALESLIATPIQTIVLTIINIKATVITMEAPVMQEEIIAVLPISIKVIAMAIPPESTARFAMIAMERPTLFLVVVM